MSWENYVRKVVPYTPGEQPKEQGMIKLNTNENPYPPAPGVRRILKEFNPDVLRLYPSATVTPLVETLAEEYHVKKEQVFVGVGSDDVLAMLFMTFFQSDKPILFPDITYSFYDVWADLYRIPYETQPLDENFLINIEDYKKPNGGIIFPNPNAPTGVFMPLEKIEEILKANRDVIVIVDEAYVDFASESALKLLDKYDNLIVVQTFSKSRSMAGMRIGFAIASEKIIKYLNDVKFSFNSYTMNQTAILAGVEAVKDNAYFKETVDKIITTRERVMVELKELGFEFPVSKSNFIFAKHPKCDAEKILEMLRSNKVYVRHFNGERVKDYLRITIGTDEQMDVLLKLLKEYLAKI